MRRILLIVVAFFVCCAFSDVSFAQSRFQEDLGKFVEDVLGRDRAAYLVSPIMAVQGDASLPLAGLIRTGSVLLDDGWHSIQVGFALEARVKATSELLASNPTLHAEITNGTAIVRRVLADVRSSTTDQTMLCDLIMISRSDSGVWSSTMVFVARYTGPHPYADGSVQAGVLDWLDEAWQALREGVNIVYYGWVQCCDECASEFRDMQTTCAQDEAAWAVCVAEANPTTGALVLCTTKGCMDKWLDYGTCCSQNGHPVTGTPE